MIELLSIDDEVLVEMMDSHDDLSAVELSTEKERD